MKPLFKLALAILLLLCLTDMPYGFYQMVRFVSAAAFAYLAYDYFRMKRDVMGFLFAALALLFQPFFKVSLGRIIWNVVDVLVAALLIYLLITALGRRKGKGRSRRR